MKRFFCLVLGAVLLLISISSASAADTAAYALPELNMSIDIPADWITFTRDMDENDPNLKLLGMDKKTVMDTILVQGIYLGTIPPDLSETIMVFMYEDSSSKDTFDFNLFSDTHLEAQAAKEIRVASLKGFTFKTKTIYTRSPAKYVVLDFEGEFNGSTEYGSLYFTTINGQGIGIMVCSFTGELTEDQRGIVKQVVDSVSFTKVLSKPHDSSGITTAGTSVVTFAVLAIIFGIIRSRQRKRQEVTFPSQEASAPGSDIRCSNCGTYYYKGSGACPVCGKSPESDPSGQNML